MWEIRDDVMNDICRRASDEYGSECCGVLLGVRDERCVLCSIPARNTLTGAMRDVGFCIDPLEMYRIEQESKVGGLEVVGVYHSHPDCEAGLSDWDRGQMVPECLYLIVSVVDGDCMEVRCHERLAAGEAVEVMYRCG